MMPLLTNRLPWNMLNMRQQAARLMTRNRHLIQAMTWGKWVEGET